MNVSVPATKWTRVPPPLLFASSLLLGLFLHSRAPLFHPAAAVVQILRWPGIAFIAAGLAHDVSSVILFIRARTTVVPFRRSSAVVMRGAYRWTRNPMYVGLTLIYLGIAMLTAAVWPLLLLPFPLLILDRRIIPAEERQLEEALGPAYAAYKTRVRRWL